MTGALDAFNAAACTAAQEQMMTCCASRSFARAMEEGRPYHEPDDLDAAIGAVFYGLSWADIAEAVSAHPRIGEPAPEGASTGEQAGAAGAADEVREALAAGNRAYEERFGHVFLICASGLTGEEMLGELQARLRNNIASERALVRRELLRITRLRAGKLLGA
ncbi:MAG: 2-oxo-4-hydroxy-4-carboxy-5-ureidoimidazoline decarboxylase [Streptosporangiaceae bacterium]|nr:2-oxo-4-hydroxy-4-carboxy-5-ureidoimidazoline decarboxylase [Streptosporangiaceae bacterium]MBV9855850.1 2-oxo-4-hydroxy-4-carboxy-5-ureidoimidazoline decarboxylase [Streptosporangiaceae bacterium]